MRSRLGALAGVVLIVLAIGLTAACGGSAADVEPTPSEVAPIVITATVAPDETTLAGLGGSPTPVPWVPPTPRPTPAPTATDFVPRTVSEDAGIFVTSPHYGARYYYHWTDNRWRGLPLRVWFASLEDLLAAYPDRIPAP